MQMVRVNKRVVSIVLAFLLLACISVTQVAAAQVLVTDSLYAYTTVQYHYGRSFTIPSGCTQIAVSAKATNLDGTSGGNTTVQLRSGSSNIYEGSISNNGQAQLPFGGMVNVTPGTTYYLRYDPSVSANIFAAAVA